MDYRETFQKNATSETSLSLGYGRRVTAEDALLFDKNVNEFTMIHFNKEIQQAASTGYARAFQLVRLENFTNLHSVYRYQDLPDGPGLQIPVEWLAQLNGDSEA